MAEYNHHRDLPGCMLPDGGEACGSYTRAIDRIAELEGELSDARADLAEYMAERPFIKALQDDETPAAYAIVDAAKNVIRMDPDTGALAIFDSPKGAADEAKNSPDGTVKVVSVAIVRA